MSTSGIPTSSTTLFISTTTSYIVKNITQYNETVTNHTSTNKTTNHTTTHKAATVYPPEYWFFVINPIFIVLLMAMSVLSVYCIHKYRTKKVASSGVKGKKESVRMKLNVMICLFLYGILRSIALGMQIQMGISTKGMTTMFDVVRIIGFYPFYAVLLVVLRKWVVTCIKLKLIMRDFPHKIVNSIFVAVHIFTYFALTAGVVKDCGNYVDFWSEFYSWLIVGIFAFLFVSFGITGCTIIFWLWRMQKGKSTFNLHTATTSSKFIKKLALSLTIFLVCVLWRMIDFAVYKFAKNDKGQWVYTSTQQVQLYPLESTFPECFPIFFCFMMYKCRLPWEKKKSSPKKSQSSSDLVDSSRDDKETSSTSISLASSTSTLNSGNLSDTDHSQSDNSHVSIELSTRG